MARFGVTLLIGVIVVMLPLQNSMASSEAANNNVAASITKCDKACNPDDSECTPGSEEICPQPKSFCYATWMNSSDGTSTILMKGCWLNPDGCEGRKDCVEAHTTKAVHFCCCEGNFCNRNFSLRPQELTTAPSTTSPRVEPKLGDPQRMQTVLYSIVPLFGVAVIIVVVYAMWRRHKRNLYVHSPLPAVDPEILAPPASESLYPLQLIELRARGRFGAVWKAQLLDNDYVAVKIFPLQDKQSWMVEQDIYGLPHMKHENILNFMTAERRGDNLSMELWLITEFHDNSSVCEYLKGHVITWSELCKICESMARGLAFLHDEIPATRGSEAKPAIAHRDFKSKNVLLKNDLTACIADFGLALKFEPGKSPGETHGLVGTRRYMAPEVLEGAICFNRDAFLRIDMYACGLVLWELVSQCKTSDGLVGDYQLPFEEEIGLHPSLEDMQDLVVTRKVRPAMKEQWLNHPGLSALVSTIEECWDQDAEARLSAGCVQERILQLSRSLNVSSSSPSSTLIAMDGDTPPKDPSV